MVVAVATDKLAGIAEIAELFEVSKQTALKYAGRPDFPAPIDRLAAGPVWKRSDVERWGRTHRPPLRPGRPPQKPT